MDRSARRSQAREHEMERLEVALDRLDESGAPRPIFAGLRGHAEAVLDDWLASQEIHAQREFSEGG